MGVSVDGLLNHDRFEFLIPGLFDFVTHNVKLAILHPLIQLTLIPQCFLILSIGLDAACQTWFTLTAGRQPQKQVLVTLHPSMLILKLPLEPLVILCEGGGGQEIGM